MDWDAPGLAGAYAERLLGLLAARGLDVGDRLLCPAAHARRPRARDRRARRGDLRHLVHGARRRSCGRPTARPVPGLFLVGGSAHPGGGLPLVTLSAQIVARLVGPA